VLVLKVVFQFYIASKQALLLFTKCSTIIVTCKYSLVVNVAYNCNFYKNVFSRRFEATLLNRIILVFRVFVNNNNKKI